jgi:hypothetical protein
MNNYTITSPSLEGLLRHDSVVYEGIRRPEIITHIFDRPSSRSAGKNSVTASQNLAEQEHEIIAEKDQRVIEQYFQDLYGIFMKRFSHFVVESNLRPDDTVKLAAMLQEMIKIKGLLAYKHIPEPEID